MMTCSLVCFGWLIKKCHYKVSSGDFDGVVFTDTKAQIDKKQNYAFQVTDKILDFIIASIKILSMKR